MMIGHRLLLFTLALSLLFTGNAWASRVSCKLPGYLDHMPDRYAAPDDDRVEYDATLPPDTGSSSVVFETVELFRNVTYFSESFRIDTAGSYQVTLTDFAFPHPLKKSALNITTATESLGSLTGPGTFSFEADPGLYYVSLFALAGRGHGRTAGDHGDGRGEEHGWHNDDSWWYRPGYRFGHGDGHGNRYGPGYWHGPMKLGQYGVEISLSQVPLPAAAWLFGSGLLGLVATARRKTA